MRRLRAQFLLRASLIFWDVLLFPDLFLADQKLFYGKGSCVVATSLPDTPRGFFLK